MNMDIAANMESFPCAFACHPDYSHYVLKFLSESRKKGLYTDLTVKVGPSVFKTHRFILASLSEYLRALMEMDFNGSTEVVLSDVCSEMFEVILDYGYTGTVLITRDNVYDLLATSDFLCVSFVKRKCEEYLIQWIGKDNGIRSLSVAYLYGLTDLMLVGRCYLTKNFDYFANEKEFAKLPLAALISVAEADKLALCSSGSTVPLKSSEQEYFLLAGVLKYLESIEQEYSADHLQLFSNVRLPAMNMGPVSALISKYAKVSSHEPFRKLIHLASEFQISQPIQNDLSSYPECWFRKRHPSRISFQQSGPYADGGQVGRVGITALQNQDQVTDPYAELKHVKMWFRLWDGRPVLGGILMEYADGLIVEGGEMVNSYEEKEFFLDKNELIVDVVIRSGWMIDSLKFVSSNGRTFGPYGGSGGGERKIGSCEFPGSHLYSISANAVETQGCLGIVSLSFKWIAFE